MTHSHHTPAPSGEGTVMLDIGGSIGALIIHTDDRWLGHEIEVSPAEDPDRRTHAAVRARHVDGTTFHCVVLDALPEGPYLIWQDGAAPLARLEVHGGTVAEFVWPADAVPGRGLAGVQRARVRVRAGSRC